MSFYWYARKVRDPDRSLAVRRAALASCLGSFSRLTSIRFALLKERYAPFLGSGPESGVTEAQILRVMDWIERDRNDFLQRLRAFEHKRIRAKLRGRRSPSDADRA